MITLYYHRGACSTSNHFALEEAGVAYEAIEVDLADRTDPLSLKVRSLNPMAQTPVLVLEDGRVLTQNAATLPFIADLAPDKALLPKQGTMQRAQADSWLAFVAADLHPTIIEYAYAALPESKAERRRVRCFYEERADRRLQVLEERLNGREYILDTGYSVIDGYALVVLHWSKPAKLPLDGYPNIAAFMKRIEDRPAVQRVRHAEGPINW